MDAQVKKLENNLSRTASGSIDGDYAPGLGFMLKGCQFNVPSKYKPLHVLGEGSYGVVWYKPLMILTEISIINTNFFSFI